MWEDLGCSQLLRKAGSRCLEPQSYPAMSPSLLPGESETLSLPAKVIFTYAGLSWTQGQGVNEGKDAAVG